MFSLCSGLHGCCCNHTQTSWESLLAQALRDAECSNHSDKNLQNWETVTSEVGDLLIPAGSGESRRITPRIIVESEEVTALIIGTAVHVLSHLHAVLGNISSRVSDRNLSVSSASNVLSHITSNSLDILCSSSGRSIVDDLVSGEEGEGVGVPCESINGSEDVLKVHRVVGRSWVGTVQGVVGAVDIKNKVDTSSCQCCHAGVVIGAVIDSVDTDSVNSQLLELCNVSCAGRGRCHWVDEFGGSTGLPIDTADVESGGSSEESCEALD